MPYTTGLVNGAGRVGVSAVFNTDGTTTESIAILAGSLCDQNLTNASCSICFETFQIRINAKITSLEL